jgi:hypothetical protein
VGKLCASRWTPWITALTRPAAKSCDETVSASSSCSTPNSGRRGSWVQAHGQSIRWKAFWIEAASSLHRGGVRAVLASRFSPETSSKGGGAGASDEGASSRWMSRRSQDRRRKSGAIARAARATSSHRMVPVGGACKRQRNVRSRRNFVVKALPAVTTRGGSAWQTSKGVFPTGARAAKHRAGSVDGVGRKAGSRGNEARITDRRTEADEANYLVDPPQSS